VTASVIISVTLPLPFEAEGQNQQRTLCWYKMLHVPVSSYI